MTDVLLFNITELTELGLFKKIYSKGGRLLNVSKISREFGKDRKTIRKYLKGHIPKTTRDRSKYLDEYKKIIEEVLKDKYQSFEYLDHLFQYMKREHKIKCSRSTFSRYIRLDDQLSGLFKQKKDNQFTERFETKPGQQAQFDLKERIRIIYETGEIIRVNVATLTLGYSRYNVREIVLDTKYETIVGFLAKAFEDIGGVPRELVIDNIKCLVDKPRTKAGADAVLNVKFTQFCQDYNIKVLPCMPYRPQTKGKTETQNKKPGMLRNYNGKYKDLYEVHEKLELINNEDNYGVSQATKLPRIFLFKKEKDELLELPTRSLRQKYHLSNSEVVVSTEALISYKSNKYSVPKRFIGKRVNLVVRNTQLQIYYNKKIIAIHEITKKLLNILSEHNLKYPIRDHKVKDKSIILDEMRNINYDNDQ